MLLAQQTVMTSRRPPFWTRLGRYLWLCCRLWQERRALGTLDHALLDDIGVSQAAAARECERAPWDIPLKRIDEDMAS